MPAYPSSKDRPALRRAGRLAAVWGWSYILTFIAFFGLSSVKDSPPLYHWLLFTSIVFVLIGILELVWRRRLLVSGQARWARVLALNEAGGTLALIWCAGWLYSLDVKVLENLLTADDRAQMNHLGATLGQQITPAMVDFSMNFAKNVTVFGFGGILLLSQLWIILRYLRLARAIEREAVVPPILK